jgi:hypothetical protein
LLIEFDESLFGNADLEIGDADLEVGNADLESASECSAMNIE